jgi:hypothetical protein
MKVKLSVSRSGNTWTQEAGQIVDMPEDEAVRMVESGQAEAVDAMPAADEPKEIETATVEPAEAAVEPQPKPRKVRK